MKKFLTIFLLGILITLFPKEIVFAKPFNMIKIEVDKDYGIFKLEEKLNLKEQLMESVLKKVKEESRQEVSLIAVGDNLIHSKIIKSGKIDKGYNYDFIYENIKDEIKDYDFKIINQETMFINNENEYSGYPNFGTPIGIGESAIKAGFNVFSLATNHSYDKKEQGILDTINFFKNKDVLSLGIYDNQKDYDSVLITEKNGIKFAFINSTYGLNGYKLPSSKRYLVNTFMDEVGKNKLLEDIKKVEDEVDFTIVLIHFGTEYTHTQTKSQETLAKEIANMGADLIIGTHPHVVEPLKEIVTENGQIVPVYYSLGNFVSNQNRINTMLGAMAKVVFVKDIDSCRIESYTMEPLVCHINNKQTLFEVYKLEDYNDDLASKHKLSSKGFTFDYLNETWKDLESKSNFRNDLD